MQHAHMVCPACLTAAAIANAPTILAGKFTPAAVLVLACDANHLSEYVSDAA